MSKQTKPPLTLTERSKTAATKLYKEVLSFEPDSEVDLSQLTEDQLFATPTVWGMGDMLSHKDIEHEIVNPKLVKHVSKITRLTDDFSHQLLQLFQANEVVYRGRYKKPFNYDELLQQVIDESVRVLELQSLGLVDREGRIPDTISNSDYIMTGKLISPRKYLLICLTVTALIFIPSAIVMLIQIHNHGFDLYSWVALWWCFILSLFFIVVIPKDYKIRRKFYNQLKQAGRL